MSKPRKFKPTVPQRRRKAEDADDVKVKTEEDETFKDLVRVAQQPGSWQRDQKDRGHRNNLTGPQQVVFGGTAGFSAASSSGKLGSSKGSFAGPSSAPNGALSKKTGRVKPEDSKADGAHFSGSTKRLVKAGDKKVFGASGQHSEPEEEEMLDYDSYYPTTLPIRPPGSLLEAEDEPSTLASADMPPDQSKEVNVAEKLELMAISDKEDTVADMLFQLPSVFPVPVKEIKREPLDRRKPNAEPHYRQAAHSLRDLPSGKLGKLLVFKSGKVKLQLGKVLLDVDLGSECQCLQQVLAVNTSTKTAVVLGDVQHRACCTPDMDSLLSGGAAPTWEQDTSTYDAKLQQWREEQALKREESPIDADESKPPSLNGNGVADMELEDQEDEQGANVKPPSRQVILEDDDD